MFNVYFFSFVYFLSSRPFTIWGTHKKLENTMHTLYIRLYSAVRHGGIGSRENDVVEFL